MNDSMRWTIVGTFCNALHARRESLSQLPLRTVMTRFCGPLRVSVEDRLGGDAQREFELSFDRPGSFRVSEVRKNVAVLANLGTIAEQLERGQAGMDLQRAAQAIEQLVGAGALSRALTSSSAAAQDSADPSTPSDASEQSALDRIFAQAEVPATARAASALDDLVAAIRTPGRTDADARRQGTAAIREAIDGTAAALLATPSVARLESTWRAVKMLVAEMPNDAAIELELLHAPREQVFDAIHEAFEAGHRVPDAIVLADPLHDASALQTFAELAEDHGVPFVVAIDGLMTEALLGDEDPVAWTRLREHPGARWLGVAANDVIVANEDGRVRTCGASMGLMCLLAQRFKQTGGFAGTTGKNGQWVAPATHTLERSTFATASAMSVDDQRRADDLGIVLLGSPPNSTVVMLAAIPSLALEATSLPHALVTTRIVRIARELAHEVGLDADAATVQKHFQNCAPRLWPASAARGISWHARLDAQADGHAQGAQRIHIQAEVPSQITGQAFVFEFDVSLRG